MGDKTGISWTDATWNPVRGCSRVSAGCQLCYAERVAARFSDEGMPYHGLAKRVDRSVRQFKMVDGEPTGDFRTISRTEPRWTGEVRLIAEHLADPLRWKKPRRIFVNSMSDLFHEKLTNEQIAAVFGVMAAAPQHTFQILTKRAKRMREWFEWAASRLSSCESTGRIAERLASDASNGGIDLDVVGLADRMDGTWPLSSVWLGVSVENQDAADERIPELLRTPAAVRFLSCEPLIGPVTLDGGAVTASGHSEDWLRGVNVPRVSWVIAGCESGPGARPCSVEWLRSLRDQCAAAGVPYFLKQAVEPTPHDQPAALLHGIRHFAKGGASLDGSKRKAGGVIELPYLDGVQHAEFPNG